MSVSHPVPRLLPTFLLVAAAAAQSSWSGPKAHPPAAIETITKKELLTHATFLASDDLQGRLTGSPGQAAAARYIAAHFERLGLEPLGDELPDGGGRSYLQHYGIKRTYVAEGSALTIGGDVLRTGYAVLGARQMDVDVRGTLRFCGFGRTRGARRDLEEGEDLRGRIAVVALKAPRGRVGKDLTVEQKFGMSFGVLGRLGRTARNLTRAGAEAVLFLQHEDRIGLSDVLNYVAVAPGKARVEANFPGADAGMGGFGQLGSGGKGVTMVLSVPASQKVLARLGIDPAAYGEFLAGGERPAAADEVDAEVQLKVVHDEHARASNVVAVLRGRDPELAEQAVVYSAHMDHVGVRMDGDVFNGADDNASGSAGLLAIASAYAGAGQRPRRSVVFLSVSGEELGLWGSQYFSDHPTWPLDKLVADLNTDMIGRSGPESGPHEVTVTPSFRHAKYSTIVRDAARFGEALGMKFTSGDKYYMRSDHYNFARKGIPVVFFCNGEHEDYHQVTDHADKLDGDKMQRIARLAFWTGWHVANADEPPRNLGRQERW
ncbi:MAG TPA: M20/M25/M40 family metallo-hydrolase [bacterium]|nr:M20/M25/M40 family metallo-hydrolase [bacterium]